MPEAKCPKCGARYFGWALLDPQHQKCKCGAQLEIINQNKGTAEGDKRQAPKEKPP